MNRDKDTMRMTWETAQRLLVSIEEAAGDDPLLGELKEDLLKAAVIYAQIRTGWQLHPPSREEVEGRETRGLHRTSAHNDFILSCDVLARQMRQQGRDVSWRTELGQDRR